MRPTTKLQRGGDYPLAWILEAHSQGLFPAQFEYARSVPEGVELYFSEDMTPAVELAVDAALATYDPDALPAQGTTIAADLKIAPFLTPELLGAPYNVVVFNQHLRPPFATRKVVTWTDYGRPLKAEYSIDGEKVAERRFIFRNQSESNPLLARRTDALYYVKKDGTLTHPPIVVEDSPYDLSSAGDISAVVGERVRTRKNITQKLNGEVLGVLMAHYQEADPAAIIETVAPFNNETRDLQADFIELGAEGYRQHLEEVDLGATAHEWLSVPVSPGITVRDYMVGTLTYTTGETFIDHPYAAEVIV